MAAATNRVSISVDNFSSIVDALFANSAHHARARAARRVEIVQLKTHQFCLEQLVIRRFRVRAKLARTLVSNIGVTFVSKNARTLQRHDPHGTFRFSVQECCRHLAVVNILQTSLSEPHACDRANRVSHTAIYLDPNDELLAIRTTRIVDVEQTTAKQRYACAEQLPRTHVPVQPLAFF